VAVDGTVGATGNISTAAQVTAQTVLCNGDLTVAGKMRCDVLEAEAGTQVTCADNFSVDGTIVASGNVSSAGQIAVQSMFCFADLTLNGIVRAAQLRSEGIAQVGSSPPAGVDLAVGGSIGATGNISTTAALMANSLVPVSGSVVTAPYDFTVEGTTRFDAFQGRSANQVTCYDNLTVQGNLTLSGNIDGWKPFFCAGRVNGINATVGSSIGRVGYTVSRPSSHPATGVIRVTFDSPAPSNTYVVHLAPMYFGIARMLDSVPPDVDGFSAVMSGSSWNLTNGVFHFSVTL
jgi:hypothetical protein